MGFGWIMAVVIAVSSSAFSAERKLKVVTTFLPAYCFTVNVTANLAEVENLTSGAGGLHDYQLTPAERRKISEADVIVMNGLGLESWLDKTLRSNPKIRIVRLSDGLKTELIPINKGDNESNPHLWLDPLLASHGVSNIVAELQKADPSHTKEFTDNAAHYTEQLS